MRSEGVKGLPLVELPAAARSRFTFPLHLSERKLLLGLIDILLANVVLMATLAWRLREPLGLLGAARHPIWYALLTAVWLIVAPLVDAYNLRKASRPYSGMLSGGGAALAVGAVYLAIPYFTPMLHISRLTILTFVLGSALAVSLWRALYAVVFSQPSFRRRALVVGAGASGQTILSVIRQHVPAEYEFVGFLDDDSAKQGTKIAGVPVIGTRRDLVRLVEQTGTTEVIVAITHADQIGPELFQAIMACHERGVHVRRVPAMYEQLTGRIPVEYIGQNLDVLVPTNGHPTRIYRATKRVVDVAAGLLGLAITGVLLPLVALAHRLEAPGPIFYRQVRLARGGKSFTLYKFRTMVVDAENDGPQWTEIRDGRVTRMGRFLRLLHLDEVPQAMNILRGDLSFVGPRPERPQFAEWLERALPFYRARYAVQPGVTGWAQVNYRYGASLEDARMKLQYDLYYIKNQSLWLDLLILVKTIGLILTFRGR